MPEKVRHFLWEMYGIYDYVYTAFFEQDIYVNMDSLTEDMKEILENFRNFEFMPCSSEEVLQNICDYTDAEEVEC